MRFTRITDRTPPMTTLFKSRNVDPKTEASTPSNDCRRTREKNTSGTVASRTENKATVRTPISLFPPYNTLRDPNRGAGRRRTCRVGLSQIREIPKICFRRWGRGHAWPNVVR